MSVIVKQRHFGLDFIRALAILSVVFGHSRFLLVSYFSNVSEFPILRGVDVFFVLSGFLIGTKFLNQTDRDNGLKYSFSIAFLKHAAWRILPMYFLFLVVNVFSYNLLQSKPLDYSVVLNCLLLIQNVFSPHIEFFWESWSLTITVWFYVVFSMGFVWVYIQTGRKHNFQWYLFLLILLFLVWPIFVRIYQHLQGGLDYFWWDVRIRKFLPARFDSPFYGLLLAWVRYYYPNIFQKMAIPGLVLAICFYLWYYLFTPVAGTVGKDIVYLITSPLSYALLLPILMRWKRMPAWISYPFTWISMLSYSMYLINMLLISYLVHYISYANYNAIFVWLMYWIVLFVFSWIFYSFYEIKVQTQFDKWSKRGVVFFRKD